MGDYLFYNGLAVVAINDILQGAQPSWDNVQDENVEITDALVDDRTVSTFDVPISASWTLFELVCHLERGAPHPDYVDEYLCSVGCSSPYKKLENPLRTGKQLWFDTTTQTNTTSPLKVKRHYKRRQDNATNATNGKEHVDKNTYMPCCRNNEGKRNIKVPRKLFE